MRMTRIFSREAPELDSRAEASSDNSRELRAIPRDTVMNRPARRHAKKITAFMATESSL